jgi:putative restriction endonuclease
LHGYRCQVCGLRLETSTGPYAEGAHIRPLGSPHHGPDIAANVLCLCPNHHVQFDDGAFTVSDDLSITGLVVGQLGTIAGHAVGLEYLMYHREHWS